MALTNKLMNVFFQPAGGGKLYRLACNSGGNIPIDPPGAIQWRDSRDQPLGQMGANFAVPNSNTSNAGIIKQCALYDELDYNKYGDRIIYPKSILETNKKMYLFGMAQDGDGRPMPYVIIEDNGMGTYIMRYYRADDTLIGPLVPSAGSVGNTQLGFWAGKLYEDGTFEGVTGPIRPHETALGIYSTRRYDWAPMYKWDRSLEFIDPDIIEDLKDYLPIEPEGEGPVEPKDGDLDGSSDPIALPLLPNLSALDTGMLAMYEMTSTQLHNLSRFLWSGAFDLDTFKKMFNDPMEAILNLSILPVESRPGVIDNVNITIGNISTDVAGAFVTNQYKIFDFGVVNINPYWGSFADYSPYTKLSIFLPYVGIKEVSIDDLMGGGVRLQGYVDKLTGSIQYMLFSNQGNPRNHGHQSVLYTWGGNCQYQIPLTASNMTNVINSLLSTTGIIAGAAAAVASGGVAAPVAAVGAASGTIGNVVGAKTHVERGGGIGGAVGIFSVQTPYFIIERPEQAYPENYDSVQGIPSDTSSPLGYYSGYVKVKAVNLSIPGATENELTKIENLLKGGVII